MRVTPATEYFQPKVVTHQTRRGLDQLEEDLPRVITALRQYGPGARTDEPIIIIPYGSVVAGLAHDDQDPRTKTDVYGRIWREPTSDIDCFVVSRWGQGQDPDHVAASVIRKWCEEHGRSVIHLNLYDASYESFKIIKRLEPEWANLLLASLFLTPAYILDNASARFLQVARATALSHITQDDWDDATTTYRQQVVEYSRPNRQTQLSAALARLAMQHGDWLSTRQFNPPTLDELKAAYQRTSSRQSFGFLSKLVHVMGQRKDDGHYGRTVGS